VIVRYDYLDCHCSHAFCGISYRLIDSDPWKTFRTLLILSASPPKIKNVES